MLLFPAVRGNAHPDCHRLGLTCPFHQWMGRKEVLKDDAIFVDLQC